MRDNGKNEGVGRVSERERILVCISASPTNAEVIRRAAALSDALGAELIALYVEDTELYDTARARAVHDHLALAEKRGAICCWRWASKRWAWRCSPCALFRCTALGAGCGLPYSTRSAPFATLGSICSGAFPA